MHLFFLFICCGREACSKGVTNSSSLLLDFHLVVVVVLARYRCCSLRPIRRFAGSVTSATSASTFPELVVSFTRLVVAVATMLSTASSAAATSPASEGACVVRCLESILIYI